MLGHPSSQVRPVPGLSPTRSSQSSIKASSPNTDERLWDKVGESLGGRLRLDDVLQLLPGASFAPYGPAAMAAGITGLIWIVHNLLAT